MESIPTLSPTAAGVDVATNDTIILLRRLVKLLESNAVVDSSNRQKIVVEQITANQIGVAVSAAAAATPAPNPISAAAPNTPLAATTYYLPVWVGPVDQRWEIMDRAKTAYNTGIRSHLTF